MSDVELRWRQTVEAALTLGESNLARELCAAMRGFYPGHLDAQYYEARLASERQEVAVAGQLLENVLQADPEHWPARWALGTIHFARGEQAVGHARCLEANRCGGPGIDAVMRARNALSTDNRSRQARPSDEQQLWDEAWHHLMQVVETDGGTSDNGSDPDFRALHAAILLEERWREQGLDAAQRLARRLLEPYPRLVKPRLLLAEWESSRGNIAEGMALLHEGRSLDPGGNVAGRLALQFVSNTYALPAPPELSRILDAVPATIRRCVDRGDVWQGPVPLQLAREHVSAKRAEPAAQPSPALQDIHKELDRLRVRVERHRPSVVRSDVPTAELIIAARAPLVQRYGEGGAAAVFEALQSLQEAIGAGNIARPYLLLLDDPESAGKWELPTVDPSNPTAVKGILDRLDERMEEAGERLAYLLIVGGHDVIAHHRLPNPVDDNDMDVLSDNPYAARGDNYLIPTRAVGRLPHESKSPDLLIGQLSRLREAWYATGRQAKLFSANWMAQLTQWRPRQASRVASQPSWGLAAQVWEEAAREVFATLQPQSDLLLCPPETSQSWEEQGLPGVPFYYFNVHGVPDKSSWYGQVDPQRPAGTDAYPVALTPTQLQRMDLRNAIVLSEACYGANPTVTDAAESMALSAIQQGCSVFVGSTNTSYASVVPPLVAADLLASSFWKILLEGAPGGVALQQAKIQLAEAMMKRNGYLEVEEQKTLMSFIFYGDPALPVVQRPYLAGTETLRQMAAKSVRGGLYQVSSKDLLQNRMDPTVLKSVQSFTREYLQGMRGAVTVRSQPVALAGRPLTLDGRIEGMVHSKQLGGRAENWYVLVQHSVAQKGVTHRQVLTMTVNPNGTVMRSHLSK